MVALLPNNYTIVTAFGSQWSSIFQIQNDDGTLANITNKTFELVVRDTLTSTGVVLFSITTTPSTYGSITVTAATLVDPTHYDVGGTVTAIAGGGTNASVQRVFLSGTATAGTQIAIQYGQTTYTSLANAVASIGSAPNFVRNPDLNEDTFLGWIAITKQCTSLQDTANALMVAAGKFSSP